METDVLFGPILTPQAFTRELDVPVLCPGVHDSVPAVPCSSKSSAGRKTVLRPGQA
jgi:hypothetical protein